MASEGEVDPNAGPNALLTDFDHSHTFEAGDLCLAPLSEDGQ